jgi:enediyne biosynthesis protein E4
VSQAAGDLFTDRAEDSGLGFTHVNGMSGKFYYAEIIGPGAALFDYDNDGDLDVYLVQGAGFRVQGAGFRGQGAGDSRSQGARGQGSGSGSGGRLFRNDLTIDANGTRTMHFVDVTEQSHIDARGYGMGAATGDFDNNGCIDLYLTNLGANQLFRNNCDGTFTDVSKHSGTDNAPSLERESSASSGEGSAKPNATAAPPWSVSAAFFDYDRDGWLDLFVGNYLNWRVDASQPCFGPSGRPDYCSPNVYQPQPSRLYHNNRDGTFTDVSMASGIVREFGPALGVSAADFNGDGWIDFYVANDGAPNQLWINQHDGTFKNTGLLSGTALSMHGKPKAGMGVGAGDVDNDGDEDLFVTNLTGEGNDLYINDGPGLFEEQSGRSGLGASSRGYTGFGTAWFDIDNDGWLDTLTVNGAVQTIESLRKVNDPLPLHQRKLLFRNAGSVVSGGVRFEDVTARGGKAFELSEVGRGAAFGDVDNDGDVDVLVANNNGKPRLLINNVGSRNHWIGLRLVGAVRLKPDTTTERAGVVSGFPGSPKLGTSAGGSRTRDMLGARVGIVREDGSTLWRRVHTDGSYASASDPRVLVGLGPSTSVRTIRVLWPSGTTQEWKTVEIDRYTTLTEGEAK